MKTGHTTCVYFRDVNNDLVDSLVVRTDEFGAFHGTFTAPIGRLTGSMTLFEAHGQKEFRVEEYKRPTFEAIFDPITSTPKLGEEATITGIAKSKRPASRRASWR